MKAWELIDELKKVRWDAEVVTAGGRVAGVTKGSKHEIYDGDRKEPAAVYTDAYLLVEGDDGK